MVKFRLLEFDAELSVSDFAEFSQKNFRILKSLQILLLYHSTYQDSESYIFCKKHLNKSSANFEIRLLQDSVFRSFGESKFR